MRRLKTVRTGGLVRALGITPQQERELLSRLARRNLIVRVRRGLYLVPARLPPGGKWSPSEFLALTTLIEDRGGRYALLTIAASTCGVQRRLRLPRANRNLPSLAA